MRVIMSPLGYSFHCARHQGADKNWSSRVLAVKAFVQRKTAAVLIQRRWRYANACPTMLLCTRRLVREFTELSTAE
jgi:trehalose-6-phosphate synthase